MAGIEDLSAFDGIIDSLNLRLRAVHDGGARVDDGADVRSDCLATDDGGTTCRLPEPSRAVNVMVFDVTAVEGIVCAAEVEDGARGSELEAELAELDCVLLDGGVEEGVL